MSKVSGHDGDGAGRRWSLLAFVLVPLAAAVILAGCGSDDDAGNDPVKSEKDAMIVTGSAKCDRASIEDALKAWSEANGGGRATLPDDPGTFRCSDGWAVAFPNVGSGYSEVTVTAVFEAEGQFWIPKDRSQVCGDTAADSEVPKSLYEAACQTN